MDNDYAQSIVDEHGSDLLNAINALNISSTGKLFLETLAKNTMLNIAYAIRNEDMQIINDIYEKQILEFKKEIKNG